MIRLAEILDNTPSDLWALVSQLGLSDAVCVMDGGEQRTRWLSSSGSQTTQPPDQDRHIDGDAPWSRSQLANLQRRYEQHGFALAAIEDTPPLDRVRLALSGRDEQLENLMTQILAMGELGNPVLGYNWSALTSWARTDVAVQLRGGALSTAYDANEMRDATNLNPHGEYTHDQLWQGLDYFMECVMPVAEEAGVVLALHPDDPPVEVIRGVPRIINSMDAYRRVLAMSDSPSNGVLLCQGNFALFSDVPAAISELGEGGRIKFVHFRDVDGTPERFYETFHDDGPTDMIACLAAYREVGFDGPMRPDHVPTLAGERNERPGYETLGRLFAIGYIKGLLEAVYGSER